MTGRKLVLCRSDAGDGGWSLHAPGSTDEEIAAGDAPCLNSGPSDWDFDRECWARPNSVDYEVAATALFSWEYERDRHEIITRRLGQMG